MRVCVILVNYNGLADTIETINSIYNNTYKKITIIVVDNGSKVNEAMIIKDKFPEVEIIRSDYNLGFAGGNNLGIDYALNYGFEYIMLLNNDTIIDNNMITILLQHTKENVVCVPAMYYYDYPSELWYGGGKINKWTGNVKHLNNFNISYVSFITGCCFFMQKETIKRIGKLDESYFMYVEDADYSIRLLDAGIKMKYVPLAKLYHKVGKSSGGELSPLSVYCTTKNRIKLIRKYPYHFYWTALPFTIISRLIRMFQYLVSGKKSWRYFYIGIRDGLKNTKNIFIQNN